MKKRRNDEADHTYVAEMAKVMSHPMKLKALMMIGQAKYPTSPIVIAKANDWPVNDVAYHIRTLRNVGALKLTGTEPARGATKHLYVLSPFGEEILTWAEKMERYARKRQRERAVLVGNNISAERKKAGLTQRQLAKRSGLTMRTLNAIENGKMLADEVTLFKLGSVLSVAPAALLDGDSP